MQSAVMSFRALPVEAGPAGTIGRILVPGDRGPVAGRRDGLGVSLERHYAKSATSVLRYQREVQLRHREPQ